MIKSIVQIRAILPRHCNQLINIIFLTLVSKHGIRLRGCDKRKKYLIRYPFAQNRLLSFTNMVLRC